MTKGIYFKVKNKERELEFQMDDIAELGDFERLSLLNGVFDVLEVENDMSRMVKDYEMLGTYMKSIHLKTDETAEYPDQDEPEINLKKSADWEDDVRMMEEDYVSMGGVPDNDDWRETGIKVYDGEEFKRCRYLCKCGKEGNRYLKDVGKKTTRYVSCHDCGEELPVRDVTGGERDSWGNWYLAGYKKTQM